MQMMEEKPQGNPPTAAVNDDGRRQSMTAH